MYNIPLFLSPSASPLAATGMTHRKTTPATMKSSCALCQKSMVSDTDKLLRLVNHLSAEIAHSQPDALTPGELREVAQIEKLAHNVKDKMSTSVRGTAPFRPPPMSRR
jgi:hypothetical protein